MLVFRSLRATPARAGRAWLLVRASNKKASFFDRELEQELIRQEILYAQPCHITVVVGPVNAGKSALLEHMFQGPGYGKSDFKPIYIDCREAAFVDAATLYRAISEQCMNNSRTGQKLQAKSSVLAQLVLRVMKAVSAKLPLDAGTIAFDKLAQALLSAPPETRLSCLAAALKAVQELVRNYTVNKDPNAPFPVICIDEFNKFRSWRENQRDELQAFLDFFVLISKQKQLAHVVLATSDSSMQEWLSDAIGAAKFQTVVIGDFPCFPVDGSTGPPLAREFLKSALRESGMPPYNQQDISDEDWDMVQGVCGGNAGLLLQAAFHFRGSWEKALIPILSPIEDSVLGGLKGNQGFDATQYATVALQLCDWKHGAVTLKSLQDPLGLSSLPDVVMALLPMIQANKLVLRPYSEWAQDLPESVFTPDSQPDVQKLRKAKVVTALTPAHLYCMKMYREQFESKAPKAQPVVQPVASSPSSKEDIEKVVKAIEEVGGEIKNIDNEIKAVANEITQLRKDKPDRYREEVLALLDKEKLLRETMQQLLKLQLMREERLLLLRRSDS